MKFRDVESVRWVSSSDRSRPGAHDREEEDFAQVALGVAWRRDSAANSEVSVKEQRGTSMKRNVVWTNYLLATLMLGLAAGASAQVPRTCSLAGVAGEWGPTLTGTVILPTGPVPFAAVERLTIDAAGNVSGTQTGSAGGTCASSDAGRVNSSVVTSNGSR